MFKFPLTAALLVAAAAAPAVAKERTTFTHDGVTYSYTETKVGDSTTVLQGTSSEGADFRYIVRKGQVVGENNGVPARFSVADAVSSKPIVTMISER